MKLCLGCMEQYDDELTKCPHCGYVEGTEQENATHMEPGSILADRYIVGKVIGYGGFGVTYIAWDPVLETKVAIKEYLPSEFSTRVVGQTQVTVFNGDKREQFNDGMKKFIEEAKKLAKFHSTPGIVKIFDSFECNNTAYIIMELLEGETLAEKLKREKTISEGQTIEMMIPVIESLNEVHADGIIHRDIAPDNIFVTKDGQVKLIDFGAARYATTTHSRSLTVVIKPGYSPEEQYRSRGDQGPHTDVYAVAATMYRMLTGQTPPDALERRAYFESKKKDILPTISKYCKDIEPNHEIAIMNALNVRIEDRTPNMDAFMAELTSPEPVKRVAGKIKKTDVLKWPLWAKIAVPAASVALIVFAVLFATGVIGFNANLKKGIVIPEGQTRVPSVISNEYTEGEQKLKESKLLIEITRSEASEKLAENLILSQNVYGGSVVQENTVVGVVVSEGIRQQIVPDVTGMEIEEAKAQLEAIGFKVVSEEQYDDTIAEGYIISQSIAPNEKVDDGSEITLTVSKGRDPSKKVEEKEVTLPNFIGMKYTDVIKEAQKLGLTVKVTERRYSKGYEKDTVMEQSPAAERKIKNTTVVEVVVSLGYSKVEVPRVLFMEEEKAIAQIKGRGLRENVTYEASETVAAGIVITQSPDEGAEVDPESVVDIVVSTGAPAFAMPDVVGATEESAKATLVGKGLSVSVNYEQDDSRTEGEVLMQSIDAGADVHRGDIIIITVCTHSDVIIVPYVVGMDQSAAEKEIKNSNLKSNVVGVYSSSVSKGLVISQSPVAGSGLHKNELVTINVSLGSDPNVSDDDSKSDIESKPDVPIDEPEDNPSIYMYDKTYSLTEGERGSLSFYYDQSKWTMTLSQSWSSSDTNVVSVDGSGNITAKKAGTAVITVKAKGKTAKGKTVESSDTCTVTVKAIIVPTKIELSDSNLTMEISETRYLTATVSPYDAVDKSVTWTSSNSSIVTVDNGFIEAISDGTATITAKTSNGVKAECKIKVNEIVPRGLALYPSAFTLTEGSSKQIEADISPTNAKNKTITWSSSDESVAKVDNSGNVTGVEEGIATITAKTSNGIAKTCTVTVEPVVPDSVTLNSTSKKVYIGDSFKLKATVSPSNAKDKSVTWSSSNSAVAKVSGGTVTALSEGSAYITVKTFNGKSNDCYVNVVKPSLTLSKTYADMYISDSLTLTATTDPTGQSVSWKSSDKNIATVSNGKITAVSEGSATITASFVYNETTYSQKCSVTVNAPRVSLDYSGQYMYIGDTFKFSGTTFPNGQSITWSSSDSSVASVSSGEVTAKSAGEVTITASMTYGEKTYKATAKITVKKPSISLTPYSETVAIDDTVKISSSVDPYGQALTWSSDNTGVATVNNGTVTGKGIGTAKITAKFTYKDVTYSDSCSITVKPGSISVYPTSKTMYIGDTATITADTSPSGKTVSWSSSNSSVATVSNGTVTAKASGSATITASFTYGGNTYKETCSITVNTPSISLSSTSKSVYIGDTFSLSTTTYPNGKTVNWSSSNTSVATVSNGNVTAKGAGSATITASFTQEGSTYKATCSVTVTKPSVTLKSHEGTLAYGREGTLSYETVPGNQSVTWKSSDTSLATVDSKGTIYLKEKTGKVVITVQLSYKGYTYSDSCTLTLIEPYVSLDKTSLTLYKGQSSTLTAKTAPKNQTITWTSSNTNVAKVSNGNVTAQGNTGTATITAKFMQNGKTYSATCKVTVKSISIKLNESSDSFTVDAFDVDYNSNTGKFDWDYGYTGWSLDGANNDDVKWSIVSGPGYLNGWRIHITQPGTVRARASITKYGYTVTADYTVTLKMTWTVTGRSSVGSYYFAKGPGYSYGSVGIAIPYGANIEIKETSIGYGSDNQKRIYGKTTYNGYTGWIGFAMA